MASPLDIITTVQSIERRPDGTFVNVGISQGAVIPRRAQVLRARSRAMIAVGVVEVAGESASDIARAIINMEFGEIQRATEVVDKDFQNRVIRVKVNT